MQKVSIYDLRHEPARKSPWLVKWSVDSRDKTRSFPTKARAAELHKRLTRAHDTGERFDPATGEPVSWGKRDETVATHTAAYIAAKWDAWAPKSRATAVECLESAVRHLVEPSTVRTMPPLDEVRSYLVDVGLIPVKHRRRQVTAADGKVERWLKGASLPLHDVTPSVVRDALQASCQRLDGTGIVSQSSQARRKSQLHGVFADAVFRQLIPSNPVTGVKIGLEIHDDDGAIDRRLIMTPAQVRQVADAIGPLYSAYVATLGFAGLRPSEAHKLANTPDELTLPVDGWGTITVYGGTVRAAKRWTGNEKTYTDRALKWRSKKASRTVPIPPELVTRLRAHIVDQGIGKGERLFTNGAGEPINSSNFSRVWKRVKVKTFPEESMLQQCRAYDLRHAAASAWLAAGVSHTVVAKRLGHGIDVLLSIYAHVLPPDEELANERIERYLASA